MKTKSITSSKKIEDYWNPYLCQFQCGEYSIEESAIEEDMLTLISPFINATYNKPIDELIKLNYVNTGLTRKRCFEKSIASNEIDDVACALCYVEKNFRLLYLKEYFIDTDLSNKFTDEDIWKLIIEIWSESEFNCSTEVSRNNWHEIFMHRPRPAVLIKSLPQTFDVYRGGSKEGFSWTRDIEVARWFQKRTDLIGIKSFLMKVTVDRDDVLFTRDSESEIVIDPDSLVSLRKLNDIKTFGTKHT